ncbi:DMT family transporter [Actinoplanes sp. NPDC048796]|uniref:DMT family transporter n=1 Tax=Actinoplanes sp. NPDC048796 TaxID=3155640 RepID=UPI00340BB744
MRDVTSLPALSGALGMVFVGGSVAVSGVLGDAPALTVQALRYAVACLLLVLYARVIGRRLVRPRGAEWLWLGGVVLTGMFVFNLALVHGARHAEPAVLGVAVACVPLLLAVGGPLLEGHTPAPRLLLAAAVVTAGAVLVQGLGRADGMGLVWALVTFVCEAGFTLLAVPLLNRHGPLGVSVHSTWMAAGVFGLAALFLEGPSPHLRAAHVFAGIYLAIAVTALAFVLWYTCVSRLGSARAGLLTGIAPIAAAAAGVALGGPMPSPLVWAGIALVALGLAVGMAPRRHLPAAASSPLPGPEVMPSLSPPTVPLALAAASPPAVAAAPLTPSATLPPAPPTPSATPPPLTPTALPTIAAPSPNPGSAAEPTAL